MTYELSCREKNNSFLVMLGYPQQPRKNKTEVKTKGTKKKKKDEEGTIAKLPSEFPQDCNESYT